MEGFAGDTGVRSARWRREATSLTRRRDRSPPSSVRKPPAKASGDQLLRRSREAPKRKIRSGVQGHRLDEEDPVRTPGKIDKPL